MLFNIKSEILLKSFIIANQQQKFSLILTINILLRVVINVSIAFFCYTYLYYQSYLQKVCCFVSLHII